MILMINRSGTKNFLSKRICGFRKRMTAVLFVIFMTGVFAQVVLGGEICGTIIDGETGLPVSGLDLNLYDADWHFVSINAMTENGDYCFTGVPEGSYYVKANPRYPFHYQPEYWNNAHTREDAELITVSESGSVTDIDFQMEPGRYIGGKILDPDLHPIADIDLNVYDPDWNKLDVDVETDVFGKYFIGGLPPGEYYVMANPIYAQPFVDQYWDHSAGPNHADLVTVTADTDTLGINFDLYRGSYIEGVVTDAETGQPVSGLSMKAYNSDQEKMRLEARTRDDGRYVLGAYRYGEYYVRVDPSYPDGYMDQFYPGVFRWDDAQTVTLDSPKPLTGIDFSVPPGSYIRGTVRAQAGGVLPDIKVKFFDSDWQALELTYTKSKSDGTYLSGALKTGSYYVKAVPVYPQPYVDVFYPDAVEPEDAQSVEVVLDHETVGIDFSLESGGYLMGTVRRDDNGEPIFNMDMDLYDADWNWVDYSDHTSVSGRFLIGALPFGSYYLRCDPSVIQNFVPEYYDDAFWPADATLIHLNETKDVANLDFALAVSGKVTGRITAEAGGTPLSDIPVEAFDLSWNKLPLHKVDTRSDGTYTLYGFPGGSYYIHAVPDETSGYFDEYYFEASSREDAVPVVVTVGSTSAGIDFTLRGENDPTPTPVLTLGVDLVMPKSMYHPGDIFYLTARVGNPGESLGNLPLVVLFDAFGQYFFWPSWRLFDPPEHPDIDYSWIPVIHGIQEIPILSPFTWPDTGEAVVTGLFFYGAILSSDFQTLIGTMDLEEFGYGP